MLSFSGSYTTGTDSAEDISCVENFLESSEIK